MLVVLGNCRDFYPSGAGSLSRSSAVALAWTSWRPFWRGERTVRRVCVCGCRDSRVFQRETFLMMKEEHAQQALEPLLFRLLELNRELQPGRVLNTVTDAGVHPLDELKARLMNRISEIQDDESLVRVRIDAVYTMFYEEHEALLGPWFRTLYQVFKLIDRSGVSDAQKIEYANIARASLSKDELFLIAVNCATSRGSEFRVLINRYGLLKHLLTSATRASWVPDIVVRNMYEKTAVMSAEERARHLDKPKSKIRNYLRRRYYRYFGGWYFEGWRLRRKPIYAIRRILKARTGR